MKPNTSNPSIQCSACGQWKRLHGTDEQGQAVQRFYPCCGENGEFVHDKDVCDECCKFKCPYRPEFPKDTVVIYYIWWAKGHGIKNFYCAEMNGEIVDYHTKNILKKNAEEKGLPWIVVRYHKKGGGKTIIERSSDKK